MGPEGIAMRLASEKKCSRRGRCAGSACLRPAVKVGKKKKVKKEVRVGWEGLKMVNEREEMGQSNNNG